MLYFCSSSYINGKGKISKTQLPSRFGCVPISNNRPEIDLFPHFLLLPKLDDALEGMMQNKKV